MHFNKEDKPYRWVQTASKATLRCMDLTRQLLSFSRRKAIEKEPLDLNGTFAELKEMISRSVTPEIDVQYFLNEDLWLTEINLGEFQDAVINLVINARDAMPHGGEIVIETSNISVDDDFASGDMDIKYGDYVQLALSDTGSGISKELLDHIFEPFFTTKEDGKGTGLGMAMVYGFVKRYDGYIKVYSEAEIGTTIRIYLPRSKIESMINEHVDNIFEIPKGHESVLIVDDEIDLLELAEKLFTELGYKTHTAESGAQALDILKTNHDFDLIFSDVVMPGGVNGYDLAEKAIKFNPDIKVLLTSGFTSRTLIKEGQEKFKNNLLSKPYRKSELAQRVRIILDNEVKETV
jgi:CheY-like chemotaxis protein